MPEVLIKAKSGWYPEFVTGYDYSSSDKQDITVRIGQKLPEIIAEAYDFAFELELRVTPLEVVLDYQKYHPLASLTTPDIGIYITVVKYEQFNGGMAWDLLDRIRRQVTAFLAEELGDQINTPDYPNIDYVIRLSTEVGASVHRNDEAMAWGST